MVDSIDLFVLETLKPTYMDLGASALPRPEFLDEPSAWERFFDVLSRTAALFPVLLLIERAPWKAELPEFVRLQIEERLRRERMLIAVLDDELDGVLHLLQNARIPFAVTDGVDISRRFYPERMFRPVSDIEIFVTPANLAAALDALGRGDYRAVQSEGAWSVLLSKRKNGPFVRMKHALTPVDSEEMTNVIFDAAGKNSIPGLPACVRALNPDDLLVYIVRYCAVRNMLMSPVWLNDLHFLFKSPSFSEKADWDKIVWSLASTNALGGAWYAFKLLEAQCGTEVPEAVSRMLGKRLGGLRRRMLSRLARPKEWFSPGEKSASSILFSRVVIDDATVMVLPEAVKFALESAERARSQGPIVRV